MSRLERLLFRRRFLATLRAELARSLARGGSATTLAPDVDAPQVA